MCQKAETGVLAQLFHESMVNFLCRSCRQHSTSAQARSVLSARSMKLRVRMWDVPTCPRNNGISENRICIMCRIWELFLRKFIYAVKPVCSIIKGKVFHFIHVYVQFMYFQMNNLGFSCLLQFLWANANHIPLPARFSIIRLSSLVISHSTI